jgi:hypothetical protein
MFWRSLQRLINMKRFRVSCWIVSTTTTSTSTVPAGLSTGRSSTRKSGLDIVCEAALPKNSKESWYEGFSNILLGRFDNDNEYEYRPCGTEYGK